MPPVSGDMCAVVRSSLPVVWIGHAAGVVLVPPAFVPIVPVVVAVSRSHAIRSPSSVPPRSLVRCPSRPAAMHPGVPVVGHPATIPSAPVRSRSGPSPSWWRASRLLISCPRRAFAMLPIAFVVVPAIVAMLPGHRSPELVPSPVSGAGAARRPPKARRSEPAGGIPQGAPPPPPSSPSRLCRSACRPSRSASCRARKARSS